MINEDSCSKSWLSAHIFFDGYIYDYTCDRVITEVAEPFVKICVSQKWIEKYFFIRYSELGYHIRLRFYGETNLLDEKVKPALENFLLEKFPADLIGYPVLDQSAQITTTSGTPKNLLWIPYEPEIDRYGGTHAILTAESVFCYSSNICFELLKKINNGDNSQRLGKGLILMVISLKVFFDDADYASTFIKSYSDGYLKSRTANKEDYSQWQSVYNNGFEIQSDRLVEYIMNIWEALEQDGDLGDPFNDYWQRQIEVRNDLKALFNNKQIFHKDNPVEDWPMVPSILLPSYLHMTNNRLGISIPEESYLAYLILNTLNKFILKEK